MYCNNKIINNNNQGLRLITLKKDEIYTIICFINYTICYIIVLSSV